MLHQGFVIHYEEGGVDQSGDLVVSLHATPRQDGYTAIIKVTENHDSGKRYAHFSMVRDVPIVLIRSMKEEVSGETEEFYAVNGGDI